VGRKKRKGPKPDYPGKIKLYADENIKLDMVEFLRERGVNIQHATEVGLSKRSDRDHFRYARKVNRWLLTTDRDYLDHVKYPFEQTKGIIVVPDTGDDSMAIKIASWLKFILVPTGKNIDNHKIEFKGNTVILYYKEKGEIMEKRLQF